MTTHAKATCVVTDEWSIIDGWWTDEPEKREYVAVEWDGRKLVFWRQPEHDKTWRVLPNAR